MNLLGALQQLLGGVGHAVNQGVSGLTHSQQQQPITDQHGGIGGPAPQMLPHQYAQLQRMQPIAPMKPMPTNGQVDPHSQALYNQAMQWYQRAQPLQVQPNITGTAGGWNGNPQELQGYFGQTQGYNQNDLSQGIQGGTVNQGYIPMQGSNGAAARPIQGSPFNQLTGMK